MLRLELDKATATLQSLNLRTEKHGEQNVPAADIDVSVARSADVLAEFSPTLKDFIFDPAGPRDLAEGLPIRDKHLKYPLHRDEEMTGATVLIGYGVGEPMRIADAKVSKFRITPHEGGGVVVEFRVQCKPEPEQIAKLYTLQASQIEISLKPVDLPELGGGEGPK